MPRRKKSEEEGESELHASAKMICGTKQDFLERPLPHSISACFCFAQQ